MSRQILQSRAWIVALIMAWSLFLFSSQRSVAQDTRLEVTITEAGTLANKLAGSTSLETLIVRGVLNDADLGTLDGLSSLKHVDLSQADFVNSQGALEGTLPSYKFYGNKHFETFSLPRNITTIGASCFYKCSALKEVSLPEGLKKINAKVFMSCYLLERVNLPNSLESIGEMAFYKTGLTSFPESSTLKSIGKSCFWGSKLQDVRLGIALESLGDAAFGGCTALKSISVSSLNGSFSAEDGVLFDKAKETLFVYPAAAERTSYQTPKTVTTIKPSAFEGTQSLETLIISEGVVGIPNSFCASAAKLTKVYLPSTIKTIDVGAFDNCKELKEFHIRAVEPPVAETGAFGVMFPNYKMNLFVPVGSKALYQAVKVWDDAFLSISEERDPLQVEQIVLVSAKQKGEYIGLNMKSEGDVTVTGASYDSPGYYKLEESTITITGKVKKLDCSSNKLLTVDASKALSLEQLLVDDNEITSITLGELPNLVRLYVGSNNLTSIDLSGLPKLADFSCWGNKFVSIDLSHNANLGSIVCRENLLIGTLDLSHCPLLQELSCFNNNIEKIKLAANNRIGHLEIQRNKIKGDAMIQLLSALPEYHAFAADDWDDYMGLNPQGIYLLEITDQEGNFAYEDEVAIATAKGWPVYSMNIEKYGEEKPQPYTGEKRPNSPLQDEQIVLVSAKQKGEYIGLNMTTDGDVTVTGASYDSPGYYKLEESTITITGKVKKLDCSSNKLLTVDASKALSLEQLLVDDNELTSITLGELPNLVRLYVGSNNLTSIDLSGLPKLADFSCWGNKFVSIDLSHNANLGSIVCRGNLLTGTLDLSHCPLLQELSCYNNQIEEIKLAANNQLGHLEIERNKIKGDAMVQLLNALPEYRDFAADDWDDYMGLNPQGIYLLEITDLEGNFAYEDEVAIATAKGWPVYSMNIEMYGEEKPQPYTGEKRPNSNTLISTANDLRVYYDSEMQQLHLESAESVTSLMIVDLSGAIVVRLEPFGSTVLELPLATGKYVALLNRADGSYAAIPFLVL